MDAVAILAMVAVSASVCASAEEETPRNGTFIRVGKDRRSPIFEVPSVRMPEEVSLEDRLLLRFVLDFAMRYEWDQVVLFLPFSSVLLRSYAPAICGYFNSYGKFISIHSTSHSLLPHSLYHNRHRVGVVVLWEPRMGVFFDQLVQLDVFNEYRSWLFIRREAYKGMNITRQLRDLNLGIYSNAVVCRVERQAVPTRAPGTRTTPPPSEEEEEAALQRYEAGEEVCVAENRDEEWYREICVTGAGLPGRIKREAAALVITLHQVYKVSRAEGDSFVLVNLGVWDAAIGLENTEDLIPVEKRYSLTNFKVVVGVRNSTFDGGVLPLNSFSAESDEDQEVHMKEVLDCLLYGLNVSREVVQYPKLGWRNEEGGWTHMLGGVVDGAIDFALDTISVNMDSLQEMSLSHPIVKTMNNIYLRRPDSGGMRDIFLAPFSPNLLVCVFSTAVLLGLAMISVAVLNYKIIQEDKAAGGARPVQKPEAAKREVKVETEERRWEVSEAALWSVSVMCMQGSQWCPSSKSGSLLLICGLLFALVIYNAYAAFITSVLSVKSTRIKTLEDLVHSGFAFGYTLGNTDELFLRTVNDSLLRELYFKGLRENDGVKDPIAGMHRAGMGDYAFFVAARTARRALVREVAHSQRCGIQELALPITRTVAAIPMSRQSPFKKILNFRALRMMETGVLHRFQSLVLPPMPKCVERNTFNSARFTDVYSAFYMIVAGWLVSAVLLVGEVLWYRRKHRHEHPGHHFPHFSSIKTFIRSHDFHLPHLGHAKD